MKQFYTLILMSIALQFSAFSQEQDTLFVHKGQSIYEFAAKEIDTMIYYRAANIIRAKSVTLNQTTATFALGNTVNLTATVLPTNTLWKTVKWISSNPAVATVNNGLVTAVTPGKATIIVYTLDGKRIASCVVNAVIPVTGITLNQSTATIFKGELLTLTATVLPVNATNQNVIWTSSNTAVATVNNGVVTAVGGGATTITARTEDGNFTATCNVTVIVPATGVELNFTNAVMAISTNFTLTPSVLPPDATNKNVSWSSNNTSVATVANGIITSHALGNAIITVTTQDGNFTATCDVLVVLEIIPVTGITLNQNTAIIHRTFTQTLVATILPATASNKNVIWSSSNTATATVNNSGVVTAHAVGATIISATTQEGGFTATCEVTVIPMVTEANVTTFVQDPTFNTIENFINNNVANYNITLMSANLETFRRNYKTQFPTFTSLTILMPRGTYKMSATGNFNDAGTLAYWYRGPNTIDEQGVVPMAAPNNPLCDATFNIPRSSAGNTPPSGYSGSSTGLGQFFTFISAATGYTVIQDELSFWFRSKSDPTSWFLCTRRSADANAVTSVALSQTAANITEGETLTLTATILPATATNKIVEWSSSNPAVATVNNGLVTSLIPGTTVIKVVTQDGNHTASCFVTVNAIVPVSGVTLNFPTAVLIPTNTITLIATVLPANATNKNVTWSSSNNAVATVNNGVVTAVSVGFATITVTTQDGGFTATCEVSVFASIIPVTGVNLDVTSAILNRTKTLQLTATVLPVDANNKNIIWSSSNEAIATVTNGFVTTVGEGVAIITVTTQDGGFTATCQITVIPMVTTENIVTYDQNPTIASLAAFLNGGNANYNITLMSSNLETWRRNYKTQFPTFLSYTILMPRSTYTGSFTTNFDNVGSNGAWYMRPTAAGIESFLPMSAPNNPLSDCTFNMPTSSLLAGFTPPSGYNGAATGAMLYIGFTQLTTGFTIIQDGTTFWFRSKANANDWFVCMRRSTEPNTITSIALSQTNANLPLNEVLNLTVSFLPASATNKTVMWSSSNPAVATVNNGVVTPLTVGSTIITVITQEGSHTASCAVTVTEPVVHVTSVTLNHTTYTLNKTETLALVATVLPANATNKTVTWASSNNAVATINNGLVTAMGNGIATITVTTVDGNLTATCDITVIVPVTSVTLNNATSTLNPEGTTTLIATVLPVDATNKNITWLSTNLAVATVNNGLVTAIDLGTSNIIVTTIDGSYKDTCVVTVIAQSVPVTGVTLNLSTYTLNRTLKFTLVPTITPEEATNHNVSWSSSNTAIATVVNGLVTGIAEGTATITVTTEDGNFTATCDVTVIKKVTIDNITTFIPEPTEDAVTAFINNYTTSYNITLMSSQLETWKNNYINSFPTFGYFSILMPRGTYTLSATANFNDKGTTGFWYNGPQAVAPDPGVNPMTGEGNNPLCDATFAVTRSSTGGTYPSGYNGSATGGFAIIEFLKLATGFTIIQDGTTFWVRNKANVNDWLVCERRATGSSVVASISLNQNTALLPVGGETTLVETVLPVAAINKTVIWKSNNPAVATVTNGFVNALSVGTAIISATTVDGTYVSNCVISVALVTPANISTYVQDPAVESLTAFLNGGTATYDITLFSANLQVLYDNYKTEIPTFSGYTILLPRGTYTMSFTANYGSGNYWYRGPQNAGDPAFTPLTGGGNNPLCDVIINIPRTSTGGTVPTGYNTATYGGFLFFTQVALTSGYTIIQEGTSFWFRSKAEPTSWFVARRR